MSLGKEIKENFQDEICTCRAMCAATALDAKKYGYPRSQFIPDIQRQPNIVVANPDNHSFVSLPKVNAVDLIPSSMSSFLSCNEQLCQKSALQFFD